MKHSRHRKTRKKHLTKRKQKTIKPKQFISLFFFALLVFQIYVPAFFTERPEIVNDKKEVVNLTTSLVMYNSNNLENKKQKEKAEEEHIVKEETSLEIDQPKKQEQVEEKPVLTLEEMQEDPLTLTLDFLPYLKGSFEENCEWMAKVIYVESRGNSDLEQQLQGLVLIARAFYPGGMWFSDGTGSLESAIFWEGQYPWAERSKGDISWVKPDEQAYKNAEAVLTGNVLEMELTKNITRSVVYANTVPQGSDIYTTTLAKNGKTVYFCYV